MSRLHLPGPFQPMPLSERGVRYKLPALFVILFLLCPLISQSQQQKASEYEIKATYLFNFARFVEWSAGTSAAKSDSFSICVIGQDPFGASLDAVLSGESVDGKAVIARRVLKPQDTANCRILFISKSEENRLGEVLTGLEKTGVLTVSDIPQFSQRGGMIQFVTVGNKVRFEVNLTTAQDAGLTLSSDLLKVAVTVRKAPQPGD